MDLIMASKCCQQTCFQQNDLRNTRTSTNETRRLVRVVSWMPFVRNYSQLDDITVVNLSWFV